MTRWLGYAALAAVLAVGLAVAADKDKKDEPKDKPAADDKAAKAFTAVQADYDKEWKDAGKDDDKRKAVLEKFSKKFLEHAKANAKDDSAVLALEAVLQAYSPRDKVKVRQEALDLLKKEYVKSKSIKNVLPTLARLGLGLSDDAGALEIVKAVAKDHPDKLTRALAMDELSNSLVYRADVASNLIRNESLRSRYEERFGEDFVKKFVDSVDDSKKEAQGLRKTLKDDYSDVLAVVDDTTPTGEGPRVGVKAPEASNDDINGKTTKLSDLKGKVVVLDFWATWCGPCRAMIPHTRKLVKANEKKPLVFISVSCDEKRDTLDDFVSKNDMPWSHWWDGPGGKAAKAYEVRAFPTIYVVDHKGIIRFKSVGFDDQLDSVVEKCIKEAEADSKKKD